MREVTDIREIQDYILALMVCVDEICRKHNLRYTLGGGNLIGAIRHKGFIPWDDDIDIFMPRPDFDRLIVILSAIKDPDIGFLSPYDCNNFYAGDVLKIYNKRTVLYECPEKYNLQYGVFVDVFPIDAMPDEENARKVYYGRYRWYFKILHVLIGYRFLKKTSFKKRVSILLAPLRSYIMKRLYNYLHEYDFDEVVYCAKLEPGRNIEKNIFKTEDFNHLIDMEYEGRYFLGLKSYDAHLRRYFGDYMQLPPKEEQVPHHNFRLYVEE